MKYAIELSREALKNIGKIPKRDQIRINDLIEGFSKDPRPVNVKKLQGDLNLYRIRMGNYRILYRIYDDQIHILIVDIDHRKDVYKKF